MIANTEEYKKENDSLEAQIGCSYMSRAVKTEDFADKESAKLVTGGSQVSSAAASNVPTPRELNI